MPKGRPAVNIKTIPAVELLRGRNRGDPTYLIDVRTPAEFRALHAQGARSIPLDRLDPRAVMDAQNRNADEPLYLICQTGTRARKACETFAVAGFDDVVVVEGGTVAWVAAGGPVVRGKRAISLERQVRIAAGLMVLLSAALALTVNLWFVLLAGFVGAGLVFAGVTDTCGMGMVLARMPWNRAGSESNRGDDGAGASCCSAPDSREGKPA